MSSPSRPPFSGKLATRVRGVSDSLTLRLNSQVQEMQRDAGLDRKAAEPVTPSPESTQPLEPIETPVPQNGAKP